MSCIAWVKVVNGPLTLELISTPSRNRISAMNFMRSQVGERLRTSVFMTALLLSGVDDPGFNRSHDLIPLPYEALQRASRRY